MISLVLLVCCLWSLASSVPGRMYDVRQAENLFEGFMTTYNKRYSSVRERNIRFDNFKKKLLEINERNVRNPVFGITQFSDLTPQEFETFTCFRNSKDDSRCKTARLSFNSSDVPDQFDWRDQGKVTSVKNQLQCGSCWAFSTVGNLEGQYAIVHNETKDFSVSQMVDCDTSNAGCDGGLMDQAMVYIQNAGGLMSDADYPYVPKDSECRFDKSKAQLQVTGCTDYYLESEDELKEVLHRVGPLSIAVQASLFSMYDGGIMEDCDLGSINHAVLLVGYGEENETPYWLIKNSWGTSFGEGGYIRIKRGANTCKLMDKGGLIASATVA